MVWVWPTSPGGALDQVTDLLQRIKELATDAANGTRQTADRQSINKEVLQVLDQINSIADSTKFGQTNLLNGTLGSVNMQIGANVGESVQFESVNVRTETLTSQVMKLNLSGAFTDGKLTADQTLRIAGKEIKLSAGDDLKKIEESINQYSGNTLVRAQGVSSSQIFTSTVTDTDLSAVLTADDTGGDLNHTITIGGEAVAFTVPQNTSDSDAVKQILVDAVNNNSNLSAKGIKASVDGDGDLVISGEKAADVEIISYQEDGAVAVSPLSPTAAEVSGPVLPTVRLFSSDPDLTSTEFDDLVDAGTDITAGAAMAKSVTDVDVTSEDGALQLMNIVEGALEKISTYGAKLGALTNRFEAAVESLTTQATNVGDARSRILDADIAAESTKIARLNILQQSGLAMLTQANQMPAAALSLLRG